MIGPKETTISERWELSGADVLLFLTATFWGVNFAVVKIALVEFPPIVFNGLRFALASALMFVLARLSGHYFKFQRRHLPYLIGLGLLGNSSYQLFFVFGIARTTADNSALILATVPAWVVLMGTLAGTERVQTKGWLGILLSLAGIVLIILGSDRETDFHFGGATLAGDLLVLLATWCWSGYTWLIRPMMRYYSSMAVTSFTALMGMLPLLLFAAPSLLRLDWAAISGTAWIALLFSGTFAITLAYFFWNFGVSRMGSARTALYSNLTPPIALLTAWLWLGETLTLQQWGGTVLTLIGVVLARRFAHPA